MKRAYLCPHCGGELNPAADIVLRASHNERAGLILLSPQPGNYEVVVPRHLELRAREMVLFGCPICGTSLTSSKDASMAEVLFRDAGGNGGTVAFSRVYGHHATYVITREKVESYGEHADASGVNYWGVGPTD